MLLSWCRLAKLKPHTIWIDNFSKLRAFQIPNLGHGAFANCLWTGMAIRTCEELDQTSLALKRTNDIITPAMPLELIADTTRDDVFELITMYGDLILDKTLDKTKRAPCRMELFENSLVHTWKVNNVPLKPEANNVTRTRHKQAITNKCDSLKNLYPDSILKWNVGSNEGLAQVLRKVYEDAGIHVSDPHKYTVLNADCNIFDRIVKVQCLIFGVVWFKFCNCMITTSSKTLTFTFCSGVQLMYDHSGGGLRLRTFVSINLAWWHSYKHAALQLWRVFSASFWAPLFHFLYPSNIFFPHPTSLVMVLAHFQFVRLAYPSFKEELLDIIKNDMICATQKLPAKNLRFICEFAIPVVRIS